MKIFIKIKCISIVLFFCIISLFSACNVSWFEDFDDDLTGKVFCNLTFYSQREEDCESPQKVQKSFLLGQPVTCADFPIIEFMNSKPGYKLVGWKYYRQSDNHSASKPFYIQTDSQDHISGLMVTLQKDEFYAVWQAQGLAPYRIFCWFENDSGEYSFNENYTQIKYGMPDTITNVEAEEVNGYIAQPIEQKSISVSGTTIVNVYYKKVSSKLVKYTVEHWVENLASDGESLYTSEEKYGKTGSLTEAEKCRDSGLELVGEIQQEEIQETGTVVKLHYTRKEFTITVYDGINPDPVYTKTGKFGLSIYVEYNNVKPVRNGYWIYEYDVEEEYEYGVWNHTTSDIYDIPSGNSKYTAKWAKSDVPFKLTAYHYLIKDEYKYADTKDISCNENYFNLDDSLTEIDRVLTDEEKEKVINNQFYYFEKNISGYQSYGCIVNSKNVSDTENTFVCSCYYLLRDYSIKVYDSNGNSKDYCGKSGQAVPEIQLPSKEGYLLKNWEYHYVKNGVLYEGTVASIQGTFTDYDIEYYPQWELITYSYGGSTTTPLDAAGSAFLSLSPSTSSVGTQTTIQVSATINGTTYENPASATALSDFEIKDVYYKGTETGAVISGNTVVLPADFIAGVYEIYVTVNYKGVLYGATLKHTRN